MRRHNDDVFDSLAGGGAMLFLLAIVMGFIFLRLCLMHAYRINSKVAQTDYASWLLWGVLALVLAAGVSALLGSALPFGIAFLAYALLLIGLDLRTGSQAVLPHSKILDPWRFGNAA